jgi:hypothetical protein
MSANEKDLQESPTMAEGSEKGNSARASSETDDRSSHFTEEEEKHLVQKIDRRILPIACAMYFFGCEPLHLPSLIGSEVVNPFSQSWTGAILVMLGSKDSLKMRWAETPQVSCLTGSIRRSSSLMCVYS